MNLFDKSKKTNLFIIPNKTTLLKDLPDELKTALTEGYTSVDIEDKVGASLINACFTMKLSHFCIGRSSLRTLLKNDVNYKGKPFDNNKWSIIKAKLLNMGLFSHMNSSGGKLSAIKIDNQDFLDLLGLSPDQIEKQKKHVILYSSPNEIEIRAEELNIYAGEVNLSAANVNFTVTPEEPKTPTEEPKVADHIPAYANEEPEPEGEILETATLTDAQYDSVAKEVIKMCASYPDSPDFSVSRLISCADRGLVVIDESHIKQLIQVLNSHDEIYVNNNTAGWWTIKLS